MPARGVAFWIKVEELAVGRFGEHVAAVPPHDAHKVPRPVEVRRLTKFVGGDVQAASAAAAAKKKKKKKEDLTQKGLIGLDILSHKQKK